jgi:hypothetical protein
MNEHALQEKILDEMMKMDGPEIAINWLYDQSGRAMPQPPTKPHIENSELLNVNSVQLYCEELKAYLNAMERYELEMADFKKKHVHNHVLEEYLKRKTDFYKVPKEKQQRLWDYATDLYPDYVEMFYFLRNVSAIII